jgi:TRAP-type C4-dicarboxylate transport system substrate-binding protein
MKPFRHTLLPALLLLLSAASTAEAQEVKIKLGTVAPQGSTWHTLLQEMGQRWAQVSNNQVQLKIYAGGTQGGEGEMLRKIGIGQLHAAAVTTVGLQEIAPEPEAEDTPGLIDSYEEYEYVHTRMRKELEAGLEKKGFIVLAWGEAGFIKLFSSEPYASLADFSKGKVFAWNGDPNSESAWRAIGFKPVVLSATDLITSLQTKMINIFAQPPLYAYTAGLFERAKYMLDLRWGILTGATVVRKDQWEKIPAELRQKLLVIAEEQGAKVVADVRKQEAEALEQMKKKGLVIVQPVDRPAWDAALAKVHEIARTKIVPTATFDRVKALRDEYRASKKK